MEDVEDFRIMPVARRLKSKLLVPREWRSREALFSPLS
jgi:hypothetical protein